MSHHPNVLYPARVKSERAGNSNGFVRRSRTTEREQEALRCLTRKQWDAADAIEWLRTPSYRHGVPIDFTLENPAGGKIWLLPWIRDCYDPDCEHPWIDTAPDEEKDGWRTQLVAFDTQHRLLGNNPCVKLTSTYCKYGEVYRKPTSILTSLAAAHLKRACSKATPCVHSYTTWPKHPDTVQAQRQDARNHLPEELVFDLLDTFVARHRRLGAHVFVCVDVFAGWGSFGRAADNYADCRLTPSERLLTYANDISNRGDRRPDINLDVIIHSSLIAILRLALVKMQVELDEALHASRSGVRDMKAFFELENKLRTTEFPDEKDDYACAALSEALKHAGIAVLFHVSFPCTTYSTAAGSTHRERLCIAPKTPLAVAHDKLLKHIMTQLVNICKLTPPGATATATTATTATAAATTETTAPSTSTATPTAPGSSSKTPKTPTTVVMGPVRAASSSVASSNRERKRPMCSTSDDEVATPAPSITSTTLEDVVAYMASTRKQHKPEEEEEEKEAEEHEEQHKEEH